MERQARRLVAISLFVLAAYIAVDATMRLFEQERPEPSPVGMALTSLSLAVMCWLARAKKETAIGLGSRAMEADAFQTNACFWLSGIVLGGITFDAAFGGGGLIRWPPSRSRT